MRRIDMIKAVIFDFNGTLFFDTDKHVEAWKEITTELIGRPMTFEEHEQIKGRTTDLILEFFTGRKASKQEAIELADRKEAAYRDLCRKDRKMLYLAEGAEEFLDALKAAKIPMTVATSSNEANVDFYFEELGIGKWFKKELVAFDDGTMKGKPAPDIYLRAAEKLGVDIADCAVFEDAVSGIASARCAGAAKIYAVASATSPEALLSEEGVTAVISDYTQITADDVLA